VRAGVARPSPLPERVAAIASAIGAEVEPLVTLTHLLPLCRDEYAVLWERVNDPGGPGDQLAEILAGVRAVLPVASGVAVLNPEVRNALAGALTASRGGPESEQLRSSRNQPPRPRRQTLTGRGMGHFRALMRWCSNDPGRERGPTLTKSSWSHCRVNIIVTLGLKYPRG